MNRASFTVLLAGALSACSKPNPLFLETFGGVSEGGSQADTGTSSVASDTVPTTGDPTTTDPVTSGMVTTEPLTTAEPASGTTEQPACTETIDDVYAGDAVTFDTFLVREPPSGPGCFLLQDGLITGCGLRNWGATDYFSLAHHDDYTQDVRSYLALRFDRELLPSIAELPDEEIKGITLELVFSFNGAAEGTKVELGVHPFKKFGPADVWKEGAGYGDPGPDVGGASFSCRDFNPICAPWGVDPMMNDADGPLQAIGDPVGSFTVTQDLNAPNGHITETMVVGADLPTMIGVFLGDRANPDSIGSGVLIRPKDLLLYNVLAVKASEVGDPTLAPKLIITRCAN